MSSTTVAIRQLFYQGRHHVHTAPRPADGGLVTVSTIAARLRADARFRANLSDLAANMGWPAPFPRYRGIVDQHAGIAG